MCYNKPLDTNHRGSTAYKRYLQKVKEHACLVQTPAKKSHHHFKIISRSNVMQILPFPLQS